MKKKNEQLTREQILALFYAKNEKNITGLSLLEELTPFLEHYFHCDYEISDGKLIVKFLNGQTFILTAEEA